MAAVAASVTEVARAALAGDRRSLARLLSIIERGGPPADAAAETIHGAAADAYTVGLTGAPGSGKSTLTDALVAVIRARGEAVAVVAIDPSSPFSGGAILGDRVRLRADHADDDGVFMRSLANRGHLGGLARAVPEVVRALGASGWRRVLVETVGVGQSEVEIAAQADTTVVVVNPGWGDEVQANKAGLLEIADVLVVNKADREGARATELDLRRMLELTGPTEWSAPIVATTALDGSGCKELCDAVDAHGDHLLRTGELDRRRGARRLAEVHVRALAAAASEIARAERSPSGRALLGRVRAGEVAPAAAVQALVAELWAG